MGYLDSKWIGGGIVDIGLRGGIASTDFVAPPPDPNPLATVTRDGRTGIYRPASAAEWDTVLAEAAIVSGGPSSLWLCQEGDGSLHDSIGVQHLAPGGGLANVYQQAVDGWRSRAVGGDLFFKQNACDIETEKTLLLVYASAGDPCVPTFLGDPGFGAQIANVGVLEAFSAGQSSIGVSVPGDDVHAWITHVTSPGNAAGTVQGFTEAEKLTPISDPTLTGTYVSLGFFGAIRLRVLYAALFRGAAANLTTAQIKTLLQTLAWPVAWTP